MEVFVGEDFLDFGHKLMEVALYTMKALVW